jgi:hypothetical protein
MLLITDDQEHFDAIFRRNSYFWLSATATAQATVIPTMGLLPAPRKPIISTSNPPVGGFAFGAQGFQPKETYHVFRK